LASSLRCAARRPTLALDRDGCAVDRRFSPEAAGPHRLEARRPLAVETNAAAGGAFRALWVVLARFGEGVPMSLRLAIEASSPVHLARLERAAGAEDAITIADATPEKVRVVVPEHVDQRPIRVGRGGDVDLPMPFDILLYRKKGKLLVASVPPDPLTDPWAEL